LEPDAITASDLRKLYGHRGGMLRPAAQIAAVDGVSFTVAHRGALGLVGESGSGKTTTAKLLVGLERASAGSVRLFGEPLPARISTAERRSLAKVIQMVFQDPYGSLDPTQSIGSGILEIVRLHTTLARDARELRTLELLDAVGIPRARASAHPRELSGGQRQRVAIARSLASDPRILVLDEAVSALDVSIQAQILNLLMELRSSLGLTYIVISHDLAVVRYLVEEVAVMYRGNIVESGPVEDVLRRPKHAYTQRLIASVPRPGMRLTRRLESAA
jgi:oligopeptide transport system ATP-binding protein